MIISRALLIAGIFEILIIFKTESQENPLHFHTQYLFNPYFVNPAIAGSKDFNNINISVRQYISKIEGAPKTQLITGHTRLRKPTKGYSWSYRNPGFTNIGIGGILYNDVIAGFRKLGTEITYAFHVPLNRSAFSHLSFGLSGTAFYYSINPNAFNVIGDPMLSEGVLNSAVPDANFGIYYYGINHYVGISAYNLFESNIKSGKNEPIKRDTIDRERMYFLLGGYKWLLNSDKYIMLEPSILVRINEETYKEFYNYIDINLRCYIQTLYFGASYRMKETLAAFMLYQFRNINIGMAYEFPFSKAVNLTFGTAQIMVGVNFGKGLNIFGDARYW
jgi:type IX secretion system PorP/SprF family membrane protein